ncbi:MAG: tRNA lysidine(34) synthetase TilS [Candidatus Omnitrophica bacterium]|nr:tRNA lysidine(34) synthetase TilS [Candidatus Omnitrophota bacterium]
MNFIEKVKDTISKYNMLSPKDRVLVCVSGGSDSVSLLYALNSIKEELGITLHIAHLNHMLRKEALKDEIFVKNLARNLKIPVTLERRDILKISKKDKSSIEDKARQIRYKFFLKTAKSKRLNKIAVAHTRDDQAETVLMRLIKGAGPRGLCGIPPKRRFDGTYIVRPLIETGKREILNFLNEEKIPYRLDKTNLKNIYLRNRIRNLLLRDLQDNFNPNIKEILANVSIEVTKAYDFLHLRARQVFKKISQFKENELILNLSKLLKYHDAIKSEVVRIAIEKKKGDLNKITYKNWEDLEYLINYGKTGGAVDIPGLTVVKDYGRLVFKQGKIKKQKERIWRLKTPGRTVIKELRVKFETLILKRIPPFFKSKDKTAEYLDYSNLKFPLFIRTRREGDRFKPLGMGIEKKLQDFFVDEKISRYKRDSIPLVISGGKIIWVVGLRISDSVKLTPKTKKILCIRYEELQG